MCLYLASEDGGDGDDDDNDDDEDDDDCLIVGGGGGIPVRGGTTYRPFVLCSFRSTSLTSPLPKVSYCNVSYAPRPGPDGWTSNPA